MNVRPASPIAFAFAVSMACQATGSAAAPKTDASENPSLPAKELAAPSLLSGPFHRVAEPVTVEGHLGRFVIESRFGTFTVHGAQLLAARVHELRAIEELQKVRKDAAFADALGKSAAGVARFASGAVNDPRKAVESVGQGAVSVLGRAGQLAKAGAAYAGDKAADALSSPPTGTSAVAPSGERAPSAFVGDPLGYNKARREWARKLEVDPYTTNPVLKPLLDDAAAASFAGNFAVGLAVGSVMAPVNYAYSFDETVRDSIWNRPPIDLVNETQAKLEALGVEGRTVRDFQRNPWFTPTFQVAMAERLAALGRVEGLTDVIATAAATQGESRVRFLLESLALLSSGRTKDNALVRVRMSGLVPVGIERSGGLTVAAAVDWAEWTEATKAFAARKELAATPRTLLLAGKASAEAKRSLAKAGWTVRDGLRP